MAQQSIPEITDCWGVAVEPMSVATRALPAWSAGSGCVGGLGGRVRA
jgi:hypothetical protein